MKKQKSTEILISQVYKDPAYRGKHIVVIGGRIYATKTGMAQVSLLEKLLKKYPSETPTILYIPKEDTLILVVWK